MIVYSNMRFLVVDDFSDFRSSVKGMLGQMAAQHIDIAANGEEALSLCRKTRYDVILHDYNLGEGKNGQQVLEELPARQALLRSASRRRVGRGASRAATRVGLCGCVGVSRCRAATPAEIRVGRRLTWMM